MFKLSVVTPEALIFEGDAVSVTAPGSMGYLQILTGHAAIITTLMHGKLTIVDKDNKSISYEISGGILEMAKNQAIVLADSAEKPTTSTPKPMFGTVD